MTKRLYRSETNRMIAGVCGGIGEVFSIDPTIIRLAFALFSLGAGSGIVAYLVCALIIPSKSSLEAEAHTIKNENNPNQQ